MSSDAKTVVPIDSLDVSTVQGTENMSRGPCEGVVFGTPSAFWIGKSQVGGRIWDAEKYMPVERVDRTTDKVVRAYWLQAFFENGQVLFPDKSIVSDYSVWQALQDELLLFPQGEHDDLFDGLQTMVEGSLRFTFSRKGLSASSQDGPRDEWWNEYLGTWEGLRQW